MYRRTALYYIRCNPCSGRTALQSLCTPVRLSGKAAVCIVRCQCNPTKKYNGEGTEQLQKGNTYNRVIYAAQTVGHVMIVIPLWLSTNLRQ